MEFPLQRKLNKYVRRSIVSAGYFLLIEAIVLVALFAVAVQAGTVEDPVANIFTGIGMAVFLGFLVIEIFFSVRALKTIDITQETGKMLATIIIFIAVPILAWVLFWVVFSLLLFS